MDGQHAPDHARRLSHLGIWQNDELTIKAYGLTAPGMAVDSDMIDTAKHVLSAEVSGRITAFGDSNGLGFAIVHPGSEGISIGIYWWAQGSVLCQHIHRKAYADAHPMDTITRPVIACVWELAVITAEHTAWRLHMMQPAADSAAYLDTWHPEGSI